MPKGQRFNSGPKYSGEPSYYVDTCFKPNSSRGVGFGFGNKRQFPEWMERNMKENPAPGSYFDHGNRTEFRSRGPTFGISHKYYEKVTIPKEASKEKAFLNKSSASNSFFIRRTQSSKEKWLNQFDAFLIFIEPIFNDIKSKSISCLLI
jgi:hypothetical protein